MSSFTSYLVVGPFEVDGMTAQQPDIVAGFPAPTAVAGLGYKLALDLSKTSLGKVASEGTAVIVHDHSVMEGHVKLPLEDKQKIRDNKGASILDERRARVTASLVFRCEFFEDVEDQTLIDVVERLVPTFFFGGGKVFPRAMGRATTVKLAKNEADLRDVLAKTPAGYVLVDRHDLLVRGSGDRDPLDALLDIVEALPQDSGETEQRYSRRYPGWLVPVFVGYQAIETVQQRSGLRHREAIGHVFAESVYSVGEFKSVRTLLVKDIGALKSAFWKHHHNPQTETYFVSASN